MDELAGKRILVTGGAGFIGSNLVEALLQIGAHVVVFDNLETGKEENILDFYDHPHFTFIKGDITVVEEIIPALTNIDAISHQAALGSVPRSISYPDRTHAVNATGFLNVLHAAKECGIKRFVFASSSSVYGDSVVSPKTIGCEGNLLSPYAVTKALNEQYAAVYGRLHGMETFGLRYFNVFGPKQDPNGVYAAAIPKFVQKMRNGEELLIHGDGEQTRDFTYVQNAVQANILALSSNKDESYGKVFNVACGQFYTLNQVVNDIKQILTEWNAFHPETTIIHGPDRPGDIRHSLADISLTERDLNYTEQVSFVQGMRMYLSKLLSH
jgi:UDP-N-acetylglucosamine 4-epimerase